MTTTQNVSIQSVSATESTVFASSGSGGVLDGGAAEATSRMQSAVTEASVGSTGVIMAGNVFELVSSSNHSVGSSATSSGGGAISGKFATATTEVTDRPTSAIKGGAMVVATNLAVLRAGGLSEVSTNAKTVAGGCGGDREFDGQLDAQQRKPGAGRPSCYT